MRLKILFYVSFILLLSACGGSQILSHVGKATVITISPTPITTVIASPPIASTKSAESIAAPQPINHTSIIDISDILNNAVATVLTAILIGLAGWLTRRFWEPLLLHRKRSPLKSRRKREELARYLQQERVKILEVLAPGSIDLQVKDIVGDKGLFIPPLWKDLNGTTPSKELIEYLTATVSTGQQILLLGEPGQGKTIVLKLAFTIMVDRFLKNSKNPIPLYIPLREFTYSTGDALDLLWTHLRNGFPLPFEDFTHLVRDNQVAFLYDGFDEIKGELTQHSINDRASSNIFSYTSILSCRRHFYDLYLSMSAIQALYFIKVELQPLKFSGTVEQYITAFCNMKQEIGHRGIITPAGEITEKIRGDELSGILKHFTTFHQKQEIKYSQLIDDVYFRTFLIATEGVSYYFIHKSFQEYYVARYIYDAIRYKGHDLDYVTQALQELIPMEVSAFLKDILNAKDLTKYDKEQMVNTLIRIYQQNSTNNGQAAVVRQYASYYLTVLDTQKAEEFLEQTYHLEPNKLVQRGMMVGLALNCHRQDILEQYIDIVNTDSEAASINIGYHLVHYGDQALEEGYYDKGGENCTGTIRAIIHHLKSEGYRNYWALDLLTLRLLLKRRGIALLLTDEEDLPYLQKFLSDDHKGQGKRFQQERRQLQKIITNTARSLARQKR